MLRRKIKAGEVLVLAREFTEKVPLLKQRLEGDEEEPCGFLREEHSRQREQTVQRMVRYGAWTDKTQTKMAGWADGKREVAQAQMDGCTDAQMDRQRGSLASTLAAASPTVEVVVEAGGRATGGVTAAVVEEAPALQRRALPPGVAHAQRAVTAIPAATRAVALAVAALVPTLGLAGGARAQRLLGGLGGRGRHLAALSSPAWHARAAEEGCQRFGAARAPMEAGGGHAAGVGGPRRRLPGASAGRPRQSRRAGTAWPTDRQLARDANRTLQLPAGARHPLATWARERLRG